MIFLGVDGGQSSTTAWIADETGTVVGQGSAGPCNHVSDSEGAAKLKRVVEECLRNAGFEAARFEAACFGMSGGPADKQKLLSEVVYSRRLVVTTDAVIALAGALGGNPGVVTIAGTGSMAYGRNAEDKEARAGGWGYVFGDEGGAFYIVRQALRASLRFEEGWGESTALHAALLNATATPDANAALHALYTSDWPRSKVAALAPIVDETASQGDQVAVEILRTAANSLADIAIAVQKQLFSSTVRHSFVGGAFRSGKLLSFFTGIVESNGGAVFRPLLSAPAGALLEAFKVAGMTPDIGKLLR